LPQTYSFITEEIKDYLKEAGFLAYKSSFVYRVTSSDLLQIVNFQKGVQSLGNKFTINILQKGMFVPNCSFDILQPGVRIGEFSNFQKDKWWVCDSETANQTVGEVKNVFAESVIPFFDHFKETQHLADFVKNERFSTFWLNPNTFIDKGYFLIRTRLYEEGLALWEGNKPSKVPKYKTIRNLIFQKEFLSVDRILEENCKLSKSNLLTKRHTT
jgi:hypothetical protein